MRGRAFSPDNSERVGGVDSFTGPKGRPHRAQAFRPVSIVQSGGGLKGRKRTLLGESAGDPSGRGFQPGRYTGLKPCAMRVRAFSPHKMAKPQRTPTACYARPGLQPA